MQAGIARAVVAVEDPDARVAGRGNALLKEAGIEVTIGCMEDDARALNAGFLTRIGQGRPLVTLKLASSLDGRIATRTGDSRWITGADARARGHLLRARHDAVMVGAASALADDPALTWPAAGHGAREPGPRRHRRQRPAACGACPHRKRRRAGDVDRLDCRTRPGRAARGLARDGGGGHRGRG